ncbi:MAG: hypothetical protein N2689_08830, partial [Verrucomicrobiae bacterium]|nr:hypothetical protein [Verrucomicrobiae bacterium]
NCAYLDCDDADRVAQHLLGRDADGRLMACLRVLPPGVKFDAPSNGWRVSRWPRWKTSRCGTTSEIPKRFSEKKVGQPAS